MADSDRRRSRPRVPKGSVAAGANGVSMRSLVASSERLAPRRGAKLELADWQEEAWKRYDDTPEVRFACSWYSAALSRVRLVLARRGAPGDDPTPLEEDDPRWGVLDDLGSAEGQSQLLAEFAPHLVCPGVAHLVAVDLGEDAAGNVTERSWTVLSHDELRVANSTTGDRWEALGADGRTYAPIADDTLPVKIWRRHPRRRREADAPIRALLGVLRELHLLTAHVEATATSRLAGAGVFAIPTEATTPVSRQNLDSPDPFLAEYLDAILTPINEPGAPSAVAPFLMRVPGEFLDKIQHIKFDRPFDEQALNLREEARRRFAAGMDMPASVLLGEEGDSNHWTQWQIDESAQKLHVAPMMETIVEGLTSGFYTPTAEALRALELLASFPDDDEIVVWYDMTNLTARPDLTLPAMEGYRDGVIGAEARRRYSGFTEEDAPSDEETLRQVILDIIRGAPTLASLLLPVIGIELPIPAGAEPLPVGTPGAVPAGEEGEGPPPRGVPPTRDEPPPGPVEEEEAVAATIGLADEAAIRDAAADAAVLAAADIVIARALERVGSRARNLARRDPADTEAIDGVAQELVHTRIHVDRYADLDALLDGAWDPLSAVCERWSIPVEPVMEVVDGYTRALLASRTHHTYDGLAEALGSPPAPA